MLDKVKKTLRNNVCCLYTAELQDVLRAKLWSKKLLHHFSAINPRKVHLIKGYCIAILSLKLSTSDGKTNTLPSIGKIYYHNYYGNSVSHEHIYFLGYDQLSG